MLLKVGYKKKFILYCPLFDKYSGKKNPNDQIFGL